MSVGLPQGPTPTIPYTFVASVARGGMGYVELCFRREGRFLRWCARKRIHEQFRTDSRFRSMFMDEARLAGLVRHPNVVGVSDVGEDGDGPYLIMDYVEGLSLSRAIRRMAASGHAIPMQVAVRICRDVALGLHAAHEVRSEDGMVLHLVHRDVSPQNVLIGFDGSVRVTDFGIAKALGNVSQTNTGVLKGNLGYLSPEQLRFEEPDRRSDIFSLGVTLYELLSGARLYPNTDGFDGTRRILSEPAPDIGEVRSDVPPQLVELLIEMLSKAREARPNTALEIAGRLEEILAELIGAEGTITVADYMDQHFALDRQQHQSYLAEHLKRLEQESLTTSRSSPALPGQASARPAPVSAPARHGKLRLRWLSLGAAATAAIVVLLEHGRPAWKDVPPAAIASPPPPVAVGQSPPVAPATPQRAVIATVVESPTTTVERPPDPMPRPKTRKHAGHRHVSSGAATTGERFHERAGEVPSGGGPHELSVPLFTQWR